MFVFFIFDHEKRSVCTERFFAAVLSNLPGKASAPVRRFGDDVGGAPGIAVAITSKIC